MKGYEQHEVRYVAVYLHSPVDIIHRVLFLWKSSNYRTFDESKGLTEKTADHL